jgi:hypothetical protein
VAWQQASSRDVAAHVVEVKMPADLAVIRMRMIESWFVDADGGGRERRERVVAAELSRGRAAILPVPPLRRDRTGAHDYSPKASPLTEMFMSLVVAQQRSSGPWLAAIAAAGATGLAMLAGALPPVLPQLVAQAGAVVTILLLAPTLVSALLSVRASSDIAQELTQTLRVLVAMIGVLTVICAISLVVQRTPAGWTPASAHGPHFGLLRTIWLVAGGLMIVDALILRSGWSRLGKQLEFRDTATGDDPVQEGEALIPSVGSPPPIPPPDRWIETGEGDRVPWGWLPVTPADEQPLATPTERGEDSRYWERAYPNSSNAERRQLIDWRTARFPSS